MERLVDYVFFLYFTSHIPISLLVDSQTVLPKWIYPKPVRYFTNQARIRPIYLKRHTARPGHMDHLFYV